MALLLTGRCNGDRTLKDGKAWLSQERVVHDRVVAQTRALLCEDAKMMRKSSSFAVVNTRGCVILGEDATEIGCGCAFMITCKLGDKLAHFMHSLHCRSLRQSIKTERPCVTTNGGQESTVHVDVEDHIVNGHPIRIFDCAGQVRHSDSMGALT